LTRVAVVGGTGAVGRHVVDPLAGGSRGRGDRALPRRRRHERGGGRTAPGAPDPAVATTGPSPWSHLSPGKRRGAARRRGGRAAPARGARTPRRRHPAGRC